MRRTLESLSDKLIKSFESSYPRTWKFKSIKINISNAFYLQEANPIFMNLKVVLQEAEEGGYIVSCPALPGCHSQGDNVEEALKNIKEAIVGCLESKILS